MIHATDSTCSEHRRAGLFPVWCQRGAVERSMEGACDNDIVKGMIQRRHCHDPRVNPKCPTAAAVAKAARDAHKGCTSITT